MINSLLLSLTQLNLFHTCKVNYTSQQAKCSMAVHNRCVLCHIGWRHTVHAFPTLHIVIWTAHRRQPCCLRNKITLWRWSLISFSWKTGDLTGGCLTVYHFLHWFFDSQYVKSQHAKLCATHNSHIRGDYCTIPLNGVWIGESSSYTVEN